MSILSRWRGERAKKLNELQRNLAGQIISAGEFVKVARSKEDPFLIDIVSVSKPKRIICNVPSDCVDQTDGKISMKSI